MNSRNVGRNAKPQHPMLLTKQLVALPPGLIYLGLAFSMAKFAAGGLDAAFHTIAAQPFGAALLIITAIGFALYGCYSIARAKYTNEI